MPTSRTPRQFASRSHITAHAVRLFRQIAHLSEDDDLYWQKMWQLHEEMHRPSWSFGPGLRRDPRPEPWWTALAKAVEAEDNRTDARAWLARETLD
jgi:hypothetical protein